MTLDTAVLADLAAKAKGATPGPWRHDDLDAFDEFPSEIEAVIDGPDGLLATFPTGIFQREGDNYGQAAWAEARETQSYRDAAYIAAFSPDVAAALLSEVETLRKALAEIVDLPCVVPDHGHGGVNPPYLEWGRVAAVARAALVSKEGNRAR